MGINSSLIFFFHDSNVQYVKRPKSFTCCSEELLTDSVLSFMFTASPEMTRADSEVCTYRIKQAKKPQHCCSAWNLLFGSVASTRSQLWANKLNTDLNSPALGLARKQGRKVTRGLHFWR